MDSVQSTSAFRCLHLCVHPSAHTLVPQECHFSTQPRIPQGCPSVVSAFHLGQCNLQVPGQALYMWNILQADHHPPGRSASSCSSPANSTAAPQGPLPCLHLSLAPAPAQSPGMPPSSAAVCSQNGCSNLCLSSLDLQRCSGNQGGRLEFRECLLMLSAWLQHDSKFAQDRKLKEAATRSCSEPWH